MRAIALLPLLFASLAAPSPAQTLDNFCSSKVVRWTAAGHRVEGFVVATPVAGQPLKVQQIGMRDTTAIGWNTPALACQIRHGNRGKSTATGFLIGALVGGFMGFAEGDDTGWCFLMCTAGEKAAAYGVTFGVIGATVGALTGSSAEWLPLNPANNDRKLGLVVNAHGIGLGVRF
jgi:hypothetical protein